MEINKDTPIVENCEEVKKPIIEIEIEEEKSVEQTETKPKNGHFEVKPTILAQIGGQDVPSEVQMDEEQDQEDNSVEEEIPKEDMERLNKGWKILKKDLSSNQRKLIDKMITIKTEKISKKMIKKIHHENGKKSDNDDAESGMLTKENVESIDQIHHQHFGEYCNDRHELRKKKKQQKKLHKKEKKMKRVVALTNYLRKYYGPYNQYNPFIPYPMDLMWYPMNYMPYPYNYNWYSFNENHVEEMGESSSSSEEDLEMFVKRFPTILSTTDSTTEDSHSFNAQTYSHSSDYCSSSEEVPKEKKEKPKRKEKKEEKKIVENDVLKPTTLPDDLQQHAIQFPQLNIPPQIQPQEKPIHQLPPIPQQMNPMNPSCVQPCAQQLPPLRQQLPQMNPMNQMNQQYGQQLPQQMPTMFPMNQIKFGPLPQRQNPSPYYPGYPQQQYYPMQQSFGNPYQQQPPRYYQN